MRGARGNADLQSSEPSPASPHPNPLPKGEGNRRFAVAAILLLVAAAATAWTLTRPQNSARLAKAVKSFGFRVQYWQATAGLIADHPLLGCGPGNFQDAYTAYKLPEASEEVADPHNFLLEVWATAGTPAMLAMLAMLACFFRDCASANSSRFGRGQSHFRRTEIGTAPWRFAKVGLERRRGASRDRPLAGVRRRTGRDSSWPFHWGNSPPPRRASPRRSWGCPWPPRASQP